MTQGEVINALARRRMLAAWMAREIVPYEAGMRAWLARARVSAEDIDELMQEAYCQIVSLPSVDHITAPRAYFMASLRHMMLRRIKRAQVVALDAIGEIENWRDESMVSPEDEAGSRITCQRVMAIIAGLPERCRRVVELRKIEGWSQKDIAAHLGMSEKAVEKQVWVGVRAIRAAWASAEAQSAQRMDQAERSAGGGAMNPALEHDRDMAARFVARMDGENWSEADEAELQLWLDGGAGREGLLLQVHAAWVAATPAAQEEVVDEAPAAQAFWRRRGFLGAMAASVAAVVGAGRWLDARSSFATRVGEIRRVPLADGSVMTINSGSELTVRMARSSREVEIAQGEAWFDVAKDTARPFIVAAGKVRARAVGTAFSVRRRETGVEVLVTEGVVESWSEEDESLRIRLVAGERALLSDTAVVQHESDRASAVDRSLAWRSGMIDLNGTSLSEAADEFNRYNERQIIIADPAVADEQFDGLFRINDPQGFAEAVKTSLSVGIDDSDPRVIRLVKLK